MLRRARWLLLAVLLLLSGFVYFTLLQRRAQVRSAATPPPPPLPQNTAASREDWTYQKYDETGGVKWEISARQMQQIKEPATVQLQHVVMKIYGKDGKSFHRVTSRSATFDAESQTMYSDGQVSITLSEPVQAKPSGRILSIESSGVSVDNKSQRLWTDREARFEFDTSSGSCTGAEYDPYTRELRMKSDVKLDWKGRGPRSQPMHIDAAGLSYKETDSQVFLAAPVRLRRASLDVLAANTIAYLSEGAIERVETTAAAGHDQAPQRRIDFDSQVLHLFFTGKGEVSRADAMEGARVVSTAPTAKTTVTADRIQLEFDPGESESTLRKAMAFGAARVQSDPIGAAPGKAPPTRILTSETVELRMRPGGREIDEVATHSPGQIDFLPNRPGERKRHMDATRLSLDYGPDNQLKSFRAVGVKTRTETPGEKGAPPKIALTSSQDMAAEFDPQSGEMRRLEQWQNFQFEEGERRATAQRAVLDAPRDLITLTTAARMHDSTGSTSADLITVDQKSGDFSASGNVTSTRLPDKKQASGGLIEAGEPMQARAQRMFVSDQNRKIRYEGAASLWQGSSRLTADSVVIDRAAGRLEANGNVVSTLPDRGGAAAPGRQPRFSTVRAPALTYSDKDKIAHYRGGVLLDRTGLQVRSADLRAFVREESTAESKETRLDHIVADGNVRVAARSPGRNRDGTSEHAEYYPGEERMLLSGGNPLLVDSQRGQTRGAVITWFARDDRLIVDNTGSGPAVSRINRN